MKIDTYLAYIQELLEPYGRLKARSMFGGTGLYMNGFFFAIIADKELFFKADKLSAKFFKQEGSQPFTYQARGKKVALAYWKVLPEVLEDPELMNQWFNKAYSSASAAKVKK